MKLKKIISLLFVITTTFTTLHKIENIKNHNGSSCLIYIVDDHLVSALTKVWLIVGVYFSKRAFAIIQNGFKIKHHSVKFYYSYASGVGKTFDKLI